MIKKATTRIVLPYLKYRSEYRMFPDDSASFDVSDPTSHPQTCLYEGSTLSSFQALSILFSWFSVHPGISKSAFEHLLNISHRYLLPSENNLPAPYKKAHEIFQPYLSPVIEYDCCVNDCVVFRNSSSGKYSKLKVSLWKQEYAGSLQMNECPL